MPRVVIAALLLIVLGAADVEATHIRYVALSYQPILDEAGNPTGSVRFRVVTAWRRSFLTFPNAPLPPNVSDQLDITRFNFGDGTTVLGATTVTSVNAVEDWFVAEAILVHQYEPGVGPVIAGFEECCRLSTLRNSADDYVFARVVVSPWAASSSPVASLPPIVVVPRGVSQFAVPAADPDGESVQFRLATATESGLTQPVPNLSIAAATGIATWDNSALQEGLYAAQIVVEDTHGASSVVDFLLKLVDIAGDPPVVELENPSIPSFIVEPRERFSVDLRATGAGPLALSASGVPIGATFTPSLDLAGSSPLSTSFSWTPGLSDQGTTRIVVLIAADANGLQTFAVLRITVRTPRQPQEIGRPFWPCAYPEDFSDPAAVVRCHLDLPYGGSIEFDAFFGATPVIATATGPVEIIETVVAFSQRFLLTPTGVGQVTVVFTRAPDENRRPVPIILTIDVRPALLTLRVLSEQRVYGAGPPTAFRFEVGGLTHGDGFEILEPLTIDGAFTETTPAGTYPLLARSAQPANYEVQYIPSTYTVSPQLLEVIADNLDMVYGNARPPLTFQYRGFVLGETADVLDEPPVAITDATPQSSIGVYGIRLTGGHARNYHFAYRAGLLTVRPRLLVVSADPATKVYGGPLPAFTSTITGFVNGDTEAQLTSPVVLTTTATPASPVGTYPITPSGAMAANYSFIYTPSALLVQPAVLFVRADDRTTRYGHPLPELTMTFEGFVNGETAAVFSMPPRATTTASATSPVGTYEITTFGGSAPNYLLVHMAGHLQVQPAPLVVRAADRTKRYGEPLPEFTFLYEGLVNGDNPAIFLVPPRALTTATATSPTGVYQIQVLAPQNPPNYVVATVPGSLSIVPAPLTIVVGNVSMIAGGAVPGPDLAFSGFVLGETVTSLDQPPAIVTPVTASTPPGTYPIAVTASARNYAVTVMPGTVTVLPVPRVSPRQRLEEVRAVVAVAATHRPAHVRWLFVKVLQLLEGALDRSLWADDFHLSTERGRQMFLHGVAAVVLLEALLPSNPELAPTIPELVGVFRELAAIAVSGAEAGGCSPDAAERARGWLEDGDRLVAAGWPGLAISRYAQAWTGATRSCAESNSLA